MPTVLFFKPIHIHLLSSASFFLLSFEFLFLSSASVFFFYDCRKNVGEEGEKRKIYQSSPTLLTLFLLFSRSLNRFPESYILHIHFSLSTA